MLKGFRNTWLGRCMALILGLHLFNISIDTVDQHIEAVPENLSFNDQESFTELIAEQILGWENAFPEIDDVDHENSKKLQKNAKIQLFPPYALESIPSAMSHLKVAFFDLLPPLLAGYSIPLLAPPKV